MTLSPRAVAEGTTDLVAGSGERMTGYGVMAAPFSSGHLLATRHFHDSTIGPGYRSVWHRAPSGDWTMYTTVDPQLSCPRYFGAALSRAVQADISNEWVDDWTLRVVVPDVLDWTFELNPILRTRVMNGISSAIPNSLWRNDSVLHAMGAVAGPFLGIGHIRLSGTAPNGQHFGANPRKMWQLRTISGTLDGADLGADAALPEQVQLGDFRLPAKGLFAVGNAFFEPVA